MSLATLANLALFPIPNFFLIHHLKTVISIIFLPRLFSNTLILSFVLDVTW